jgi:ribonuclease VapC
MGSSQVGSPHEGGPRSPRRVKRARHHRSLADELDTIGKQCAALPVLDPRQPAFTQAIEAAAGRLISAATFVESSMILESRHGAEGVRALDRLLAAANIEIVTVDVLQAHAAREAFRQFGKARHPAGRNFGDCFA